MDISDELREFAFKLPPLPEEALRDLVVFSGSINPDLPARRWHRPDVGGTLVADHQLSRPAQIAADWERAELFETLLRSDIDHPGLFQPMVIRPTACGKTHVAQLRQIGKTETLRKLMKGHFNHPLWFARAPEPVAPLPNVVPTLSKLIS